MQFSSAVFQLVLAASSVAAQSSICGSQIYTPGTGTCYNGQLCLYARDAATGLNNIVTFPCGAQCFDAGKYVCNAGTLVDINNGVASTARLSSAATAATTQTQGATAPATTIESAAVISSQSRAASSAASRPAAPSVARSSSARSGGAATTPTSSSRAATSSAAAGAGHRQADLSNKVVACGAVVLASVFAGLLV